MASIYDNIPTWSAIAENKFHIVTYESRFYYAIRTMTAAENSSAPSASLQTNWDGYILLNSVLVPNFWWKPSYNTNVNAAPRIKINQFGNGYQQRIQDGLNTNLLDFQLVFENRSEAEAVSILHFLHQRNAQESFIYNLPTIYSKSTSNLNTRFVSPEWSSNYVSYNNYTINARFKEVPV